MVKIRLKKLGHTHDSVYRIVVADSHYPRDGRFIEEVGIYNPHTNPSLVKFNEEACKNWMLKGAKPTDTVMKLLKISGIVK